MRVKTTVTKRAKHKKILRLAKGYRGARSKLYRTAKEAVFHAGEYAFSGRKQRKRQNKKHWIILINAALREEGINYSLFINKLNKKNVLLDRKILSSIAENDRSTFKKIIEFVNR